MKLLFDENLSSRLVGALADQFPNSSHVNLVGLAGATELEIWTYAREHDFSVVGFAICSRMGSTRAAP